MQYDTSAKRRDNLRWIAIAGILLYAVVRSIVVWATLESYGVNPWIFFFIDATTGVTYVLGIEQLIRGLKSKLNTFWHMLIWGFVASISFAAPYVYMYWAGQEMPTSFVVGIGIVILLLLANVILTLRRRIQHKK